VDVAKFESLVEPLRRKSAESKAKHGHALIDGYTTTPEVIAHVEDRMDVIFPDKYKYFMTRYGGGVFGFVELLPIVGPDEESRDGDLRTVNDQFFPARDFVAVAEVGTGDYWGFPVTRGRCHDQVWFHFHDHDDREQAAADFLEFVAEHGLQSSAGRTLQRRHR
jgi:hypothetical protein